MIVFAADVRLSGSDLLRPALVKTLSGVALGPDRVLRLELDGSRQAMEAMRAGRADIAVVAFAPDEVLPEGEFRLIPLAYQVVTFAVNDANPVRQASYAQLGGIWGEKEPLRFRQWGDLGATGVWALKPISLNMVDAPESLAGDVFRYTVLTNPSFSTTVFKLPTVDELRLKVLIDDNCIGMFPGVLHDTAGLHVLLVSRDAKDVPFGPTPENIHSGDYPIRLPFYIAFDASRAQRLGAVLEALLGDEVAAALDGAGFVAVPANARRGALRSVGAK
jgi:phosphate transport system substrate-binding protein